MNEERFDVYTRKGEHLGVRTKSFCHSSSAGVYHKPVWIWITNEINEILVQKRSKYKKNNPGLYDMPSAGHVIAGEDIIDGCIRETYEELGIETKSYDYEFIAEYISDETWELAQIYLLKLLKNTSFKLDKKEVEEVKWLTLDEFKELLFSDKFVNHAKEYKEKVINYLNTRFKGVNNYGKQQ